MRPPLLNQAAALVREFAICRSLHVRSKVKHRRMGFEIDDQLFSLSANGKVAELKALISLSRANPNASNDRGWTALMFAARNGHHEVIDLLMQNGARPHQRNNLGQTAYDIASFWSHGVVMDALKSADKDGREATHFFTVQHLSRESHRRKDPNWLRQTLLTSPHTRILLFVNTFPVLQGSNKRYTLKQFLPSELTEFIDFEDHEKSEVVFLGQDTANESEAILFAVNVSKEKFEEKMRSILGGDDILVLERIRDAFVLKSEQAAVAGLAHSLFDWHTKCLYCQICGSRTRFAEAGYKRCCTNKDCLTEREVKNSSYPRLDPSIIAAVVSADRKRILLARGQKFIPSMWSCVAGFMEPGENIEQACRREVMEECGVTVGRVDYHSSQPWPFPTQIMIGLTAQALTDTITVDRSELDDARWFSRQEVVKMMTRTHPDGHFLPPHHAIAHHLVKSFLHDTAAKI